MRQGYQFRKTKIIITLGKACSSVESLVTLLCAGIDAVRITTRFLNTSERDTVLNNLRLAEKLANRPICVILSLREGDIRVGSANTETELTLSPGALLRIVSNKGSTDKPNTIICNSPAFALMVKPGDKLLVDFGKAVFTVLRIEDDSEGHTPSPRTSDSKETGRKDSDVGWTNVVRGPVFEETAGFNRYKRSSQKRFKAKKVVFCRAENECKLDKQDPLTFLNASSFDASTWNNELEDIRLLEWSKTKAVDIIIYKQISNKEELEDLWSFEIPVGSRRFVGLQNKETAENPEFYLEASDGCSIGRGMLAVETSLSQACVLQKEIVRMCNTKNKPVFISTQVLESMVVNDKPSRAEIVDAYCAVTDGADALMLTGETAFGKYPEQSVSALHRICIEAELNFDYKAHRELVFRSLPTPFAPSLGICYFAAEAVDKVRAKCIICITKTGKTASKLAMFMPACMVVAVTDNIQTLRYLRVVRGIYPVLAEQHDPETDTEALALRASLEAGIVEQGDLVVFVGSRKDSFVEGSTTSLRIIHA
jgi:pyruvate kinase